jgi:hypothetical protein
LKLELNGLFSSTGRWVATLVRYVVGGVCRTDAETATGPAVCQDVIFVAFMLLGCVVAGVTIVSVFSAFVKRTIDYELYT